MATSQELSEEVLEDSPIEGLDESILENSPSGPDSDLDVLLYYDASSNFSRTENGFRADEVPYDVIEHALGRGADLTVYADVLVGGPLVFELGDDVCVEIGRVACGYNLEGKEELQKLASQYDSKEVY